MSGIHTNEIIPHFDYKKIDTEYDIFCLETSRKYISTGAGIIDAPLMNKNVRAVLFETGRRFYVLLNHSEDNFGNMKKILSDAEELEKYQLLQLLINGLTAKKHPLLRFNNLTGHLYVFRPEWTHKSKENVIWSIPTIEVKVLENCLIKLNVRTFTSTRLRSKITFTKKKFEDYPKYVLSTDNSMRRKTADDDAKAPDFILRQIDGRKSGVKFLNISSETDFEATKIGVLNEVAENFNARYSGMAAIEFKTIAEYTTIDTTATAKENVKAVRAYLADKKIILIDCVRNEQSGMFCENIVSLINEKYGCNAKAGSRLSKNALNMSGFTVQHITFEDFSHNSKHAVSTVVNELIIKDDIRRGMFSLFDWGCMGFEKDITFGLSTGGDSPKYFFMTVRPDGSFFFSEQQMNLLEVNEYSACVQIFGDDKQVEGMIKYSDDDILAIRGTGMFTLPEYMGLSAELKSGNTALRNKESRDEYLTSVTEIRSFHRDGRDFYFVGVCGSGIQSALRNAALIRCVEQYGTVSGDFRRMLPLMNVAFVRNGRLTVVPFPFKYLREYILGT